MNGLARRFMILAVISAIVGMGWGIQMSASGDHGLSIAHAHLNLLGWVGFAIFAFYYHLVPQAAQGRLARAHFALAVTGVVFIVPGIVSAVQGTGETLAKIGSILTVLSLIAFAAVVLRPHRASAPSRPAVA